MKKVLMEPEDVIRELLIKGNIVRVTDEDLHHASKVLNRLRMQNLLLKYVLGFVIAVYAVFFYCVVFN